MINFFDTGIEFLKGVGPQKSALLKEELNISTFGDLLLHYPFRYEDRTKYYNISELHEDMPNVQIKGRLGNFKQAGPPRRKRLVAKFQDDSGEIELIWFKGGQWVIKKLIPGHEYLVFGKPNRYGNKINIAHPEIDVITEGQKEDKYLQPVYSTTEKLQSGYLGSKNIAKLQRNLLDKAFNHIKENLNQNLLQSLGLMSRNQAIINVHFPSDEITLKKARFRMKFEELFFIQLKLLSLKSDRELEFKGKIFNSASLVTRFYEQHLPFELTNAQKNVVKEIYKDMRSGKQMNRLLQGDVGSGKTIVAFLAMLLAIDCKTQTALMAPTEILAIQHYNGLKVFAGNVGLKIALLTGSTKQSERKLLLKELRNGRLNILVGTHALIEDKVNFANLGLAVIDEQHRFGVSQRSSLWNKNKEDIYPHVLVMTATPIPRTLAMALYGDLDISVIDEMPKGRKPIKTTHRFDSNRLKVWGFIKDQIRLGRQVYIVYPLIEESEKMDLKDLMDGYESIQRSFPGLPVSILHGRMKSETKEFEMNRFLKGETKIMVATTVIEVGVDVSNASVMIIENAERFGLAQLHQLRGRVGRGADQSYCILMTGYKLSEDSKIRIETMVRTNNGFEIADVDLQLRGPGDLMGTQQSGLLELTIADLRKDGKILQVAREQAICVLQEDPLLAKSENQIMKKYLKRQQQAPVIFSYVG